MPAENEILASALLGSLVAAITVVGLAYLVAWGASLVSELMVRRELKRESKQ